MHRMPMSTILLSLLFALGVWCDSAPERETNPTVTDNDGDNLVAVYDCNDNDPSIGKCGEGGACRSPEHCGEGLSSKDRVWSSKEFASRWLGGPVLIRSSFSDVP